MAKALFVTGTGTDVGKTYISALMSKALREAGLNAAYYKAAVSGNVRRPDGSLIPGDARFVREFAHLVPPSGRPGGGKPAGAARHPGGLSGGVRSARGRDRGGQRRHPVPPAL